MTALKHERPRTRLSSRAQRGILVFADTAAALALPRSTSNDLRATIRAYQIASR